MSDLRLSVAQRVETEFDCDCKQTALRFRRCSNGAIQWVRQCLRCGKASTAIAVAKLTYAEQCAASEFDQDLREAWEEKRRAFWKRCSTEVRQEQRDEWFEWYQTYLESDEWKETRAKRLAIDRHQCKAQLSGCQGRAVEVHHRSYEMLREIGESPLWDLVSVCLRCHARMHPHMRPKEIRGREAA